MSEQDPRSTEDQLADQQRLEEIHNEIHREMEERAKSSAPGPRGGAVPRSVLAFREPSPGDTSAEAPEGTPTRGEVHLESRGEGLPRNRGGVPVETVSQAQAAKKKYWEEKEIKKKAQESAAQRKRENRHKASSQRKAIELANSPVRSAEFAKMFTDLYSEFGKFSGDVQRRMQLLSGRIESLVIAWSIVSHDIQEKYGYSASAEMCEMYKAAVPRANEIWVEWRNTVMGIVGGAEGGMNLVDMKKSIDDWNANLVNPRIDHRVFRPDWTLWKFSQGNPDATMTLDEKKEFALALGYQDNEAQAIVNGNFPKPKELQVAQEEDEVKESADEDAGA